MTYNEKKTWADEAREYACEIVKQHGFKVSRAYDVPFTGWECLECPNNTTGFFKMYIYTTAQNKIGYAIATHYKILEKDHLNSNMPCNLFSSTTNNFEDDKEDIEYVTKKMIAKIKGMNNSIRHSIESIEKKCIINHDIDNTFDKFNEVVSNGTVI